MLKLREEEPALSRGDFDPVFAYHREILWSLIGCIREIAIEGQLRLAANLNPEMPSMPPVGAVAIAIEIHQVSPHIPCLFAI